LDPVFRWIEKGAAIISRAFILVASVMMAALMFIVCLDLSLRYFFNSPLVWGTEVTEILLLYITFLGTAQVFKEDSHVVVDIVLVVVSARVRRILYIISTTLVGIVSAVLIYYGFVATYNHYIRGVFNPTILETPIALIIAIIPIGCVPLFLEVLVKARRTSRLRREE
jgi:C4-dicarboxylate transporter DctQ subunit